MNGYITLEQVVHAENILLAKISRRRRAHSNFKRMLRLNERILLPRVNEWLSWTIKQIQPGLSKMRGRTPTAKVKSIADWDKIKAEGVVILKPTLHEILTNGGNSVMRKRLVRKQERFDPIGVEAIKWANQHSAELVVEVTDKTIKGIRSYIVQGVKAGKSVPTIARELRPLVGLTEKNIFAVANFHERLILDRPELTAAKQREMTETYARRLHRDRAQTIARTETSFSLNEGQRQGYDQMGITHLERVEDQTDPADECTGTDGRIYTIEEAEGVLPAHPNCEGTWIAAPADLEPKPAEPPRPVKPTAPGEPAKWKPAKSIAEAEKWGVQYGIEGVVAEGKKLSLKEWNIIGKEMSKLPDDLLRKMKANGGKMDLVVDSGITVHPSYKQYKGVTPRGWEGTGRTWDDIPGAGGTKGDPTSVIVANKTTVGHGSVNATLHEYAHTVDAIYKKGFTNLSESAKWQKLWKGNNSKGVIRTPYQAGYAEEYWAESFAEYFNSPGHGYLPKNVMTYFRNLFEGGT